MNPKFSQISAAEEDAKYLKQLASEFKVPIKIIIERIVKLVRINEHIIKNEEYINIFDSDKLIEGIRKSFVKENNRILGFYLNNEKRIKEMHANMLYLLKADEKEAENIHPFWSEFDFQLDTYRTYLKIKYNLKNEEQIVDEFKKTLTENHFNDFLLARERTRKRRLSIIRD